ncbi:alpha/beta hydrolase [Phormidesmis priestleyi]
MSLSAIAIPPKSGSPQSLIVVLHGWGANAQDVAFLCSLLELSDCQFMLPDAPFPHPYGIGGKMWYDLSDNLNFQTDITTQPDLLTSRQLLTDWLKSLESETGVPLSRTILGGFSQGGAMTLDVGLTLPLAGLMVLSGYLHGAIAPLETAIPPLLIVHGKQDQVVPLRAAQMAHDRLTTLGATIQYQEFNMGHEISPQVLNEMQQFIRHTLK